MNHESSQTRELVAERPLCAAHNRYQTKILRRSRDRATLGHHSIIITCRYGNTALPTSYFVLSATVPKAGQRWPAAEPELAALHADVFISHTINIT
eukprot:scaffold13197_cov100-Skeletonema_dohrnii-CCMP3373.AAC.3